ncbi:amidohydrolase family protein [Lutimaribacter marinistellae]|uniref:Amidohydrolase family protein n=1 Tax=Lutimaribacter marinistellae TaxID=1820329 RepID=A0ABV7TMC5_9RHOB
MFERRTFLGTIGAATMVGMSGCGRVRRFFQPEVSRTAIDIHAHFFNGRDVPVVGFLKQTIIRDPHAPVDRDMTSDAFLKLLKFILLTNTPTAQQELDRLETEPDPAASVDIVARDERNVAEGIARFSNEAGRATAGLTTSRPAEFTILDRIARETGAPDIRTTLRTPNAQGRALAARIYQTGQAEGLTTLEEREYIHRSEFMQTIRWVGLLTRSRLDILAELDRLYGGPGLIRIFSPSLVDFGAWFVTEERVTPIANQIEVVSRIARSYDKALILPFAPFCPLRAALEREDDPSVDPLRHVKLAVLEKGFMGVKLYPPMGFRPTGNTGSLSWVPRAPRGGAAALDPELRALYDWCVANEVPIKAHANNSVAAGPGTGAMADPAGWRKLMQEESYRDLQLNLAHFGGFNETAGFDPLVQQDDWEETLARMVTEFSNLYYDVSFWTEAANPDNPARPRVMAKAGSLLRRSPDMVERMMYGSDWSMIGRVPEHPAYLAGVLAAFDELGLDADDVERVMGGNAARYLGLDRNGKQRERLDRFFAEHPIYEEIFQG